MRLDPLDVEAAAVVGDPDDDVPALLEGLEPDRPALRLAAGATLGRALEPVVGRVADHVGEGVLDELEDLPVELRVAALEPQVDVLAELEPEIARQPRQLAPGAPDRLHARAHDVVLQLGRDLVEPLQRRLERGAGLVADRLEQLVPRQHELAH